MYSKTKFNYVCKSTLLFYTLSELHWITYWANIAGKLRQNHVQASSAIIRWLNVVSKKGQLNIIALIQLLTTWDDRARWNLN